MLSKYFQHGLRNPKLPCSIWTCRMVSKPVIQLIWASIVVYIWTNTECCFGTSWTIAAEMMRWGYLVHRLNTTSLEYRSGIYDCVHMRHALVHQVFVSSLGGTSSSQILLYCDVINSEHKLRQFSNSLTFYSRILGFNTYTRYLHRHMHTQNTVRSVKKRKLGTSP